MLKPAHPALLLLAVTIALAGCGSPSPPEPSSSRPGSAPPAATTASIRAARQQRPLPSLGDTGRSRSPRARPEALADSTAANDVVAPQPPPGSCHARGTGPFSRPDPACTPGALNPAVTQNTIDATICVRGWTASVRPPEAVTEREKAASLAAYGDTGAISGYEYDHFVPLELGGATNDPRNLWPEPGGSPNPKDAVENELREDVCARRLRLASAQREIVADWTALARR